MYGCFVEKITFQQTMRIFLCPLLDNPFSGMLDDDDCRDTTNHDNANDEKQDDWNKVDNDPVGGLPSIQHYMYMVRKAFTVG